MRKIPALDLILAFVIVCIAMTLTVVVTFAAPTISDEMQRTHQFPTIKE